VRRGLLSSGGVGAASLIRDGLVAAYQFDEAAATQTLTDYSGNGNTGTLGSSSSAQAADPLPVVAPAYYLFSGLSGDAPRVTLPDLSAAVGASLTIQVCFRADDASATRDIVRYINHAAAAPFAAAQLFVASSNQLRYLLGFSDNSFSNTLIQSITVGTWYDLAITYNGTTAITYVNGAQVTSTNHNKALDIISANSYIGAGNVSQELFAGGICAMQFYSRPLTAGEIAQNSAINRARIPAGISPNAAAATNAATPLTTPTYDGSGEATHPDVIEWPAFWANPAGYTHLMAMTPYQTANANLENPSILASDDDGETWEVPSGLTNPIDPQPGGVGEHNADTELISDGSTYVWCFWESTDAGLCAKRSADGVTWTALTEDILPGQAFDVSPAIVKQGGIYHMWGILSTDYTMRYYTATTLPGPWTLQGVCRSIVPIATTATFQAWHPNVEWSEARQEWHMFLCVITVGVYKLWFGTSPNGLNWTFSRTPLLSPSAAAWDNSRIYRSAALWNGTTYDLWYGGVSSGNAWRIGKTTITGL
jgi:hypothetical protein